MVSSRSQAKFTSLAICLVALLAVDAFAQPGGGRFGGNRFGGGGFGGFGGRPEDLLRRDDVRKELELLDDQIEQLDELNQRRREGGNRFEGLRDLPQEERAEKMREIFAEMQEERQKELDKVLLPHQAKRLKQLSAQYSTRGGSTRALTSGSIAEELDISDEQKENIRKKAEELQKELTEKIAELRKEMQEEVLGELTASQRRKYKEMMGDAFEFEQQAFGRGNFGGGGARFGQGQGGGNRPRFGQGGGNRPGGGPQGRGRRERPDSE